MVTLLFSYDDEDRYGGGNTEVDRLLLRSTDGNFTICTSFHRPTCIGILTQHIYSLLLYVSCRLKAVIYIFLKSKITFYNCDTP